MLEELGGYILVHRVLLGKLESHGKHGRSVKCHPSRSIRLLEVSTRRERLRAVKDPDVVESKKTAAENVLPLSVLTVHPPGEVDEKLVEDPAQEDPVALTCGPGEFVDPPRRPSVDGRIHIGEPKFIGGNLTIGVHVPLTQQEQKLLL